jgi:hypothetical protein
MRYHQEGVPLDERTTTPDYQQFLTFLKRQVVRFNLREIVKIHDDRYIYVKLLERTGSRNTGYFKEIHEYDARVLFNEHYLLRNKPPNMKMARQQNSLRLYSNDEDALIKVIKQLEVDDSAIRLISYPNASQVDTLLSGKEFNSHADKFKYKVFLKPVTSEGIPALGNYLRSIAHTDEVEVPKHCQMALDGVMTRWSWAMYTRSYLYAKDEHILLLIQMLAGQRYSDAIELALPEEN